MSFAQNFAENPVHERSHMPSHASIFDVNSENQPVVAGRLSEGIAKPTNLKFLGKIIHRHRRIESVINKIDPFEFNAKRISVYPEAIPLKQK